MKGMMNTAVRHQHRGYSKGSTATDDGRSQWLKRGAEDIAQDQDRNFDQDGNLHPSCQRDAHLLRHFQEIVILDPVKLLDSWTRVSITLAIWVMNPAEFHNVRLFWNDYISENA